MDTATGHNTTAGDVLVETDAQNASRKSRRSEVLANDESNAAVGDDGKDCQTEYGSVAHKSNGHANGTLNSVAGVRDLAAGEGDLGSETDSQCADTCRQIQEIYRQRNHLLKTRIMLDNRLVAYVASELGYFAGMEEDDREARWKAARELIKQIEAGDDSSCDAVKARVSGLVLHDRNTRGNFQSLLDGYEKQLAALGEQLPAADFAKGIKGFGVLRLACIIGETGDLSNYANPAKVWKRLGLAPFNGQMPSTWRRKGGLSAEEWTAVGYSPRRRSSMFVITDLLVKGNYIYDRGEDGKVMKGDDGKKCKQPDYYKAYYDKVREESEVKHPDWTPNHHKYHSHLLMAKRLVLNLWVRWNKAEREIMPGTETPAATAEYSDRELVGAA